MPSLSLLVVAALVTLAALLWRGSRRGRSHKAALAVTALWCLTLLLALRFCGRTYPGIYHPESTLLNDIFNGNWLFTGMGYGLAMLAAGANIALILATPAPGMRRALVTVKWVSIGLACAIILYGFYWASLLERLP